MRCSPYRLVLTSAALQCKTYGSTGASGAERAIASLSCTIVSVMPDHNNAVCHRNTHQAVQFCSFCQRDHRRLQFAVRADDMRYYGFESRKPPGSTPSHPKG